MGKDIKEAIQSTTKKLSDTFQDLETTNDNDMQVKKESYIFATSELYDMDEIGCSMNKLTIFNTVCAKLNM